MCVANFAVNVLRMRKKIGFLMLWKLEAKYNMAIIAPILYLSFSTSFFSAVAAKAAPSQATDAPPPAAETSPPPAAPAATPPAPPPQPAQPKPGV